MTSIFTKIINGEIPCYKIFEDEHYFAFLDINPLAKGHTLVIPKIEVDNIFDLEPQVLAGLHIFAQKIAKGLKKVIECNRIGLTVIGIEVPHAHIHLIPINGIMDMDFSKKKISMNPDEFAEIAFKIQQAI